MTTLLLMLKLLPPLLPLPLRRSSSSPPHLLKIPPIPLHKRPHNPQIPTPPMRHIPSIDLDPTPIRLHVGPLDGHVGVAEDGLAQVVVAVVDVDLLELLFERVESGGGGLGVRLTYHCLAERTASGQVSFVERRRGD